MSGPTPDGPRPDSGSTLRETAEARIAAEPPGRPGIEDPRALIHELRVHQVELEVQNEELRRAEAEASAARDRYADLYHSAPVGYLTLDPRGRILEANLTAAKLLNADLGALPGSLLSDFVARPSQDALHLHRKAVFSDGGSQHCRVKVDPGHAETRCIRLESLAGEHRAAPCCRTVLRDITAQSNAERDARQRLEETARLHRAHTANELATVLAHELNQPLAVIALYAETAMLTLARSGRSDTELEELLGHIAAQAGRAGKIIHRLRDFVRPAEAKRGRIDLNAVLQDALAFVEPRARRAGVALHRDLADGLPAMMGLDIQLRQVMLNLLSNALDAIEADDSQDGTIEVTTERAGERVRVTVRDNGPGLDAKQTRVVFGPLFTSKPDGLGMGLKISRKLVEAHGGRLWAEPGRRGGVFVFELPLFEKAPNHADEPGGGRNHAGAADHK